MKKIFERYPIFRYLIGSYVKGFFGAAALFAVLFAVLWLTGLYAQLETVLDLKYNSPFVFVPLYGFAALAVLCLLVGFLMYFYKYKRTKTKSTFYKTFSNILNEVQTGGSKNEVL